MRVHPGVYITHTGRPTRRQREWIAVLGAWPAALAAESALPDPPPVIRLAIAHGRTAVVPDRTVLRRMTHFEERVDWRAHPPRVWGDQALLDVLGDRLDHSDVAGAFGKLATAGEVTARVTYGLVFDDTCRTATWIATVLQRRGWSGRLRPCPRCPD